MSNVKSALLVGVGGQGAILISKIMSGGPRYGPAGRQRVHAGPLGR